MVPPPITSSRTQSRCLLFLTMMALPSFSYLYRTECSTFVSKIVALCLSLIQKNTGASLPAASVADSTLGMKNEGTAK